MKPDFEQFKDIPGTTIFTIELAREGCDVAVVDVRFGDAAERVLDGIRAAGRPGFTAERDGTDKEVFLVTHIEPLAPAPPLAPGMVVLEPPDGGVVVEGELGVVV